MPDGRKLRNFAGAAAHVVCADGRVTVDVRLTRSPLPKTKVSPKTILLSGLLQLASADVERVVLQELSENPALELLETGYCDRCGAMLTRSSCPYCQTETWERGMAASSVHLRKSSSPQWGDQQDTDPLARVAAPRSLRDCVLRELCVQLSGSELEIASLLLDNLDDHGLLDCDPESVASSLGVQLSQVLKVLAAIQRQDPVGIGARTVQESLLVQLECSDHDEELVSLSRRLIEEHWEALAKGRLKRIANVLQVEVEDVQRARDFIGSSLCPYPAHAYPGHSGYGEEPVEAYYLRPDVIISVKGSHGQEEFDVLFPEEQRFRLTVHSAYRELLDSLRGEAAESDREAYEHVREWVDRSKLFISSWQERWATLRRVVEALVIHQREFLLNDASRLCPLTRAQLADMLGLHESTVGRAVASKYAEIPGGRIVALADFFDGSLKAKALIKELVSQESHPLTDTELEALLAKAGIRIARRTVAKYRLALGILPSELR